MVKKDKSITGRDAYPYASMHTILWKIIHMVGNSPSASGHIFLHGATNLNGRG